MEQELERRLSNTLERRYRNHLRDGGLYDGVISLERIDLNVVRKAIGNIEPAVHVACNLERAVANAHEMLEGLRPVAEALGSISRAESADDVIRTVCSGHLAATGLMEGRTYYKARAGEAIYYAERAQQGDRSGIGTNKGYQGIVDNLRPEIEELLVNMGIPGHNAGGAVRNASPATARKIVRAGRYLLRTAKKMNARADEAQRPEDVSP